MRRRCLINNYQDHVENKKIKGQKITLTTEGEKIVIDHIDLAPGENGILPVNLEIEGICFKYALAQPLTVLKTDLGVYAFFFTPEGMKSEYHFNGDVEIKSELGDLRTSENTTVFCTPDEMTMFEVRSGAHSLHVITLTREQSLDFQVIDWMGKRAVVLSGGTLLVSDTTAKLEHDSCTADLAVFPQKILPIPRTISSCGKNGPFTLYRLEKEKYTITPVVEQIGAGRYITKIPRWDRQKIKNVILLVHCEGDIGHAFIDGDMIADNFWNGATWEIGLREFAKRLEETPLTFYITPLKKNPW
jgi:hypothetical protein